MILHNIDHVYQKNNMHEEGLQENDDFLRQNLLVSIEENASPQDTVWE